jgi:hypothetical protein
MASPAPESKPTTAIPAPEPTDSGKVASCLETAQELWTNGQMREAVRWIQRGADAAEEDGNDMRALALARLGAELTAQMKGSGSPAAPKAPSPPRPGGEKAEKSDKNEKAEKNEDAPAPASLSPSPPRARVSNPPPLPGGVSPSSPTASAAASVAPSPPSQAPKPPSPSVSAAADSVGATPSSAEAASSSSSGPESSARPSTKTPPADRPSIKPATSRTPGPLSTAPAKPAATSVAPAASAALVEDVPSAKGKTSTPLSELISSGLAQRVSVKRSALDASLLVVRPAAGNGAKVITGARQAVLIYLDGDSDS